MLRKLAPLFLVFVFLSLSGCGAQAEVPTHEEAVALWEAKQYEDAFEAWKMRADEGDVEGAYNTGFMLEKGIGTEADIDQAVEYLRAAAKAGNFFAQHRLGVLLLDTADTKEEADEAFMWLEKAAQVDVEKVFASYAKGIYALGYNFYTDIRPTLIGEKDPNPNYRGGMRYHLYFSVNEPLQIVYLEDKKVSFLGENLETITLGVFPFPTYSGLAELAKTNPELALTIGQEKREHDKTLQPLGITKEGGTFESLTEFQGFPIRERVGEWAKMGSSYAITMQADRRLTGFSDTLGVLDGTALPAEAIDLYQKAAEHGNARAQSIYSLILVNRGDREEGLRQMEIAAQEGNLDAQQNLMNYWISPGFGNNPKVAFDFASKFAQMGNIEAMAVLAFFYQFGFGTEIDLQKSKIWMEKANTQNNGFANAAISQGYLTQIGNKSSKNSYFAKLENLANHGNPEAINLFCLYYFVGQKSDGNAILSSLKERVVFDLEKATFWCAKGAEKGTPDALMFNGFLNFFSTPPDIVEGIKLFKLYGNSEKTIRDFLVGLQIPFSEEDFLEAEKLKEQFLEENKKIEN